MKLTDLRLLLGLLTAHRRRQVWWLLGLMLVCSVAEVVSIGAIVPFMSVLSDADAFMARAELRWLVEGLRLRSVDDFVLTFVALFITAVLLASMVRLLMVWGTARFCGAAGAELCASVFARTLSQPLLAHAQQNSSEFIGAIVKIDSVMGVLFAWLNFLSALLISSAIAIALIWLNPGIALAAAAILGLAYAAIARLTARRLRRNSTEFAFHATLRNRHALETLGNVREVILSGAHASHVRLFADSDRHLRRASASSNFVGASPRFLIEGLAVSSLALLAFLNFQHDGGVMAVIPVLAAFAMGAQRAIPQLQQAYASWALITAYRDSLHDVATLLERQPEALQAAATSPEPLTLAQSLRLHEVGFRYGPDLPWVLDGASFEIRRGQHVGLVGRTGAGKSTLADVLMGLIVPQRGALYLDGEAVTGERLARWRRAIGHVPQGVYLNDASIAANVALGVPDDRIDRGRLLDAARRAHLTDFVTQLPAGLDTVVGERGVRLSGGQRQRIGIARALYRGASLLVLDEPTSALDTSTEDAIIDALSDLGPEVTVVIIAHRANTLRRCDVVYRVEDGQVTPATDL